MTQKFSPEELIIISDFDGTITKQDSNDLLFRTFGNEESKRIEELYAEGLIGTKEGMLRHFDILRLFKGEYVDFIQNTIEIDEDFNRFYDFVEKKAIPLIIVSGGFVNAIELILKKAGISIKEIYANNLIFNGDNINPEFIHEIKECSGNFRTCGNCKLHYLEKYREIGKKVIFIGDGLTDRCIAGAADLVFAKGSLNKYCSDNNIACIKFNNFNDVIDSLRGMII